MEVSVKRAFQSCKLKHKDKSKRKAWKAAFFCMLWIVWRKRNQLAFEEGVLNIQKLKWSLITNLWLWIKNIQAVHKLSLMEFIDLIGG